MWPFLVSLGVFNLVMSLISSFYDGCVPASFRNEGFIFGLDPSLFFTTILLCYVSFCWWSDVSAESGEHTKFTIRGLKIGMSLFILSEVMFFFSFFWAFFHVSLSPAIEVGSVWPPVGFEGMVLSYQKVPLLNTLLLLASGISVTYAHAAFHSNSFYEELVNINVDRGILSDILVSLFGTKGEKSLVLENESVLVFSVHDCKNFLLKTSLARFKATVSLCRGIVGMWVTLSFAIMFILLQISEYLEAIFNISDSSYGSTFFVMTGFHGLHVLVGTVFLSVCLFRICNEAFFFKGSTGLECAIWYWHFVDVVWLFLYLSIYWWGNMVFVNNFLGFDFIANADAVYEPQLSFQDPATIFMEEIISLHNYVCLYLVFISFVLMFILFEILE